MAKSKKSPYMVFQTEEEYRKFYFKVYESGRITGFKEGRILALSFFQEAIEKDFGVYEVLEAEYETRSRGLRKYRDKINENKKLEDREFEEMFDRILSEQEECDNV